MDIFASIIHLSFIFHSHGFAACMLQWGSELACVARVFVEQEVCDQVVLLLKRHCAPLRCINRATELTAYHTSASFEVMLVSSF